MLLKPKLEISVALALGGAILAFGGLEFWTLLGIYGIVPGLFGLLGLFMLYSGIAALAARKKLSIAIDESGIEQPVGSLLMLNLRRTLIARDNIEVISKHESIRGRLIEITMKSGEKVLVQARYYCELDQFLSHCRRYGLPVA
jgi:hypothetical protein